MGILDDLFNTGAADGSGAAAPLANLGGTLLQAYGSELSGASHLQQGIEQQQADEFQAAQLRQNAGQAQASAQRSSIDIQRQVALISSRALAVAAANGGGASSPSVISNMSRIAGEGAYRQSLAIYGGNEQAQHDQLQASGLEYSGAMAKQNAQSIYDASQVNTAATLMKGGSSLFSKYGGNTPSSNSGDLGVSLSGNGGAFMGGGGSGSNAWEADF